MAALLFCALRFLSSLTHVRSCEEKLKGTLGHWPGQGRLRLTVVFKADHNAAGTGLAKLLNLYSMYGAGQRAGLARVRRLSAKRDSELSAQRSPLTEFATTPPGALQTQQL